MIKTAVNLVTSIGVSQVVNNIVEVTTPNNLSRAKKVASFIGGIVISTIVTSMAVDQVEKSVDEVVGIFKNTDKNEDVQTEEA